MSESKGKFNQQAYDLLLEMGKNVKAAETALKTAKAKQDGAYTIGMQAAAVAGNLPDFMATISRLEDNIKMGRDKLHTRFNAEARMEVGKHGEKYKVPGSVQVVKSRVKAAFEAGIAITDDKLKSEDNEYGVRSFGEVTRALEADKTARRLREEEQRVSSLTGEDKLRHECQTYMQTIQKNLDSVNGKDLTELHSVLELIAKGAAKAESKPEPESGKAGEALSAAA